jgi:hypothetical protein
VKQLDPDKLEPGDIVLTTGNALSSKAVRLATISEISHAMVYVESYSVIDATRDGVQARNIQRTLFEDDATIVGLRLARGITQDEQAKIVEYVRAAVGSEYSIREAIRAPLKRGSKTRRQFCSRLAAQAYEAAGIKLADNPDFCTPEALRQSPLLNNLVSVTIDVSEESADAIKGKLDVTELMRKAHDFILKGARQLDRSIQSLNDMHQYLVDHPDNDHLILELYRRSGYLNLWQIEQDRNPWMFDLRMMNSLGEPEAMTAYCRSTIREDQSGPSRYVNNHALSVRYALQTGLDTFRVLAELYETLSFQQFRRRAVAIAWFQAHNMPGEIPTSPAPEPEANSPAWLDALERWNPMSAAHIARIVMLAGRSDVCGVCGDDDSQEYRLADPEASPSPVKVMRLCSDCAVIRSGEGWRARGL